MVPGHTTDRSNVSRSVRTYEMPGARLEARRARGF